MPRVRSVLDLWCFSTPSSLIRSLPIKLTLGGLVSLAFHLDKLLSLPIVKYVAEVFDSF